MLRAGAAAEEGHTISVTISITKGEGGRRRGEISRLRDATRGLRRADIVNESSNITYMGLGGSETRFGVEDVARLCEGGRSARRSLLRTDRDQEPSGGARRPNSLKIKKETTHVIVC